MFAITLIVMAVSAASQMHEIEISNFKYRSHCSIVVEIWKELGGYTLLDPETVGSSECCHYKQSLIPGILCSQMNFVVEIL